MLSLRFMMAFTVFKKHVRMLVKAPFVGVAQVLSKTLSDGEFGWGGTSVK